MMEGRSIAHKLAARRANHLSTLSARAADDPLDGVRRAALEGNWSYYEKRVPEGLFAILGEVEALEAERHELERVHEETLRAVSDFPLERWQEERFNDRFNIRRKVVVMSST